MSALLSADAPLTEEERNDLLAQEQALKKQLRQVRAKLGKEKNGMYTALTEAVDKAPVLSAGAAEDMEPPTAEELKPSDAEIAGNAMLDEINEQEMEKHYQKVYDYTIALKASLRDKDWIKKASVLLCAGDADIPREEQDHIPFQVEYVTVGKNVSRHATPLLPYDEANWNIQHGANADFLGFSYGFLEQLIDGDMPSEDKKKGGPFFAEILSYIDREQFFRFKVTCVKFYVAFNERYLRKEEAELRKVCHKMFFLSQKTFVFFTKNFCFFYNEILFFSQ
jgi:hypothetical protein